jgi:ABC-type branched-subunit amino acid transport system ATPase component
MSALRVDSVTAGYTKLPIIHEVSINVAPGQLACVVGPNGSGKSTLLKAIMGVIKTASGRVATGDADITGLQTHQVVRAGVSYVPQSANVFPSLTVVENLEMGAYIRSGSLQESVEAVLSSFPDLAQARRKRGGELSGGQRNLLGVARALMTNPRVILVDEPSAGLAPANTRIIWEQLARIAEEGTGVVVVEQNVDLAMENADWCFVLVAGRNRIDCSPHDLERDELHGMFLGKEMDRVGH